MRDAALDGGGFFTHILELPISVGWPKSDDHGQFSPTAHRGLRMVEKTGLVCEDAFLRAKRRSASWIIDQEANHIPLRSAIWNKY